MYRPFRLSAELLAVGTRNNVRLPLDDKLLEPCGSGHTPAVFRGGAKTSLSTQPAKNPAARAVELPLHTSHLSSSSASPDCYKWSRNANYHREVPKSQERGLARGQPRCCPYPDLVRVPEAEASSVFGLCATSLPSVIQKLPLLFEVDAFEELLGSPLDVRTLSPSCGFSVKSGTLPSLPVLC